MQEPDGQEENVSVPGQRMIWAEAGIERLPSELLEKKSWDECDEVVLRCRDFVALKLLILKLAR